MTSCRCSGSPARVDHAFRRPGVRAIAHNRWQSARHRSQELQRSDFHHVGSRHGEAYRSHALHRGKASGGAATETRFLTADELQGLAGEVDERDAALVLLAGYVGLRWGRLRATP